MQSYLRVSVHLEGIGVWIGLVTTSCRWIDVPHHGCPIASRQDRGCKCFLQLLLLFAVLGTTVLEPDLIIETSRERRISQPSRSSGRRWNLFAPLSSRSNQAERAIFKYHHRRPSVATQFTPVSINKRKTDALPSRSFKCMALLIA